MGNTHIVVERIYYLLDLYENNLINNNDVKLNIIMQDNVIAIYHNNIKYIDEFVLSFNEKEKDLYNYLCLKIIMKLFSKVVMHFDGYILTNPHHRENIKICILDDDIVKIVNYLISIQNDVFINDNLDIIKDLKKKSKHKFFGLKELYLLNRRIEMSEKLLKRRIQ